MVKGIPSPPPSISFVFPPFSSSLFLPPSLWRLKFPFHRCLAGHSTSPAPAQLPIDVIDAHPAPSMTLCFPLPFPFLFCWPHPCVPSLVSLLPLLCVRFPFLLIHNSHLFDTWSPWFCCSPSSFSSFASPAQPSLLPTAGSWKIKITGASTNKRIRIYGCPKFSYVLRVELS